MQLPLYQVNAFASEAFAGNPAAVVPLREWIDEALLQKIAAENGIVTAFLTGGAGRYALRWFTPSAEITGICGHGTLAAAYVAFAHLGETGSCVRFTVPAGPLRVTRCEDGTFVLDLPAFATTPLVRDKAMGLAFGSEVEVLDGGLDLLAVLPSMDAVADFQPLHEALLALPGRAVIVSAPGAGKVDFVSRWFGPKQGTTEDRGFTGSAHSALVPFWSKRLGKTRLRARQLSPRGTTVECALHGERVLLFCAAVQYLEGRISV